jgi:glycerol transport system ATP-binding protein
MIEINHVNKWYGPTFQALKDCTTKVAKGEVVVVCGPSGSGKSTLIKCVNALEPIQEGEIILDGIKVNDPKTDLPKLRARVGMVFQHFELFPHLKIIENLCLAQEKVLDRSHDEAMVKAAKLLDRVGLKDHAKKYPAELSGGQQQRVALARALAKGAPLMLLDEPLVNLDYKLREELRDELTQLFAAGDSTVIYATTEPGEALLLGGYTAVLDAGELLQYGPTAEVFHAPKSLRVARAFSDPPMNLISAEAASLGVKLNAGPELSIPLPAAASKSLTIGVRAGALRIDRREGDAALAGKVELAEISGSDTFVHVETSVGEVVAQLTGVHHFDLGAPITLHLNPAQVYVFGADGALLVAPERKGDR